MDKKPLIGVSILAVALLVLGSLSNVVGFQTVQSSQQNIIKERINERELLFQTIVDIADNKEIQRIILKYQMNRGIFPASEIPVVTKNQLKMMYFFGLILSKVIRKSTMQSMIHQNQLFYPELQNKISVVIENDAILMEEIIQLKNSKCDCECETIEQWDYPIICASLFLIFFLLCIPYGLSAGLFSIFHDSLLGILVVPWMILIEIIAMPIFFLLVLFGCWDIPTPEILNIRDIGD